jgi:hypothetical protein
MLAEEAAFTSIIAQFEGPRWSHACAQRRERLLSPRVRNPLASPQKAWLQVRMSGLAAVTAGVLHSKGCDDERRLASVVVALAALCLTMPIVADRNVPSQRRKPWRIFGEIPNWQS